MSSGDAVGVTARLAQHAAEIPEACAVALGDDRIGWSDLFAAVERIAAFLAERTTPGGGVALHLDSGPALALLAIAAMHAGRQAQILDPDWPDDTLTELLAALRPDLVVTGSVPSPGFTGAVPCIALDDRALGFAGCADALGAPAAHAPVPAVTDGRSVFYVGFTSGSTGRPKGYARDHRSWVESFRGDAAEFGIARGDVVVAPGTLKHSLFLYALMNGLHAGATVVLCRSFQPGEVLRRIRTHRATVLYGVPAQLRLLSDAADPPVGGLRWLLSSGAKWPVDALPALRRGFPGARFAEFYGASELSFVTVAKDDEPVPAGSVGRAFTGVDITIRDARGRRLPAGRTGLVFVDSPLVFSGYVAADGESLRRAGRALSVGDVGRLDADGYLHLVGRAGRMIIVAGRNIYPEPVEQRLETHPAVAAAAVLGVEDALRGERLVGLVALRPGAGATAADLAGHARAALRAHEVPRRYGLLRDWPRTPSGKTDFAAVRRALADGALEWLA